MRDPSDSAESDGRGWSQVWPLLDRAVAIIILLINVGIGVATFMGDQYTWLPNMIAIAIGCIPCLLIWRPRFKHALLFTVMTVVCCWGSYTLCDVSSGPVTTVLHPVHDFGWIFTLYGAARTVSLVSSPE